MAHANAGSRLIEPAPDPCYFPLENYQTKRRICLMLLRAEGAALGALYCKWSGRVAPHDMIGPLSCFVTGLGVGGIAGLLLAPKPGTDTRQDVRVAAEAAVIDSKRALEAQRERIATAAQVGLSAYRRAMGDSD